MMSFWRTLFVISVGVWTLATLTPQIECAWSKCPSNGLSVDYDGVVTGVRPGSPTAAASIVAGDTIAAPLPRGLFRDPPQVLTFALMHAGVSRQVRLVPKPHASTKSDELRLLALCASYLVFLTVGSALLLLRPSAVTWSFYLYCVLRRYGDLWFYWPGSESFFWLNVLAFGSLGGASCALVTIFALYFPNNRLNGWRKRAQPLAVGLAVVLPLAWFCILVRLNFLGIPSQAPIEGLVLLTSAVYLAAAAIFIVTLLQSRGDERQRLRWILIFPIVLILRVVAINLPDSLSVWFSDPLIALAVCIPIAVAYAVIRRRVFDVEFAISRALVYASITSVVAGTFLMLDWFMSRQFAETRFTLTAEIIVALALGSGLTMLHRNVDRLVDSVFFRQRRRAEKRLARAASAVLLAESPEAVDQFLVHEPIQALDLTSASIFRREDSSNEFARATTAGRGQSDLAVLRPDDPLVLHLLAERAPVRLADVAWDDRSTTVQSGGSALAVPIFLREQLVAIVLYGPHSNGADIDPDELRSILPLAERAGAAYDHIEARSLRAQVALLTHERDLREREIEALRGSR